MINKYINHQNIYNELNIIIFFNLNKNYCVNNYKNNRYNVFNSKLHICKGHFKVGVKLT